MKEGFEPNSKDSREGESRARTVSLMKNILHVVYSFINTPRYSKLSAKLTLAWKNLFEKQFLEKEHVQMQC